MNLKNYTILIDFMTLRSYVL